MTKEQAWAVIQAAFGMHEGERGYVLTSPTARRAVEAACGVVPSAHQLSKGDEEQAMEYWGILLRRLGDALVQV